MATTWRSEQSPNLPSGGERVSVRGKHLWCGAEPVRVHGVTYGSFARRGDGSRFPPNASIRRDFAQMRNIGLDTIRTYEVPPPDLLEAAREFGVRVLVGLEYHDWRMETGVGRVGRRRITDAACRAVDEALASLAGRPEVLAVAVGNEVPVDLVRLHGRAHVERTLSGMVERLHAGDPEMLATYVSFPTTEFLQVPNVDLVAFNVFIERGAPFRRYVEHLQLVSRDRPLLISELGLASAIHGEEGQAAVVAEQLQCIDEVGAAGAIVFSWTDDWVVGGEKIPGWGFGLTTEERRAKPVCSVVSEWSNRTYPKGLRGEWPRVSVIVCAYNEKAMIGACLDSVLASSYPDLELILCDDGSTDATAAIAAERGVRALGLDHGGLSKARNAGLEAASGDIVAYLDADAVCHPDWPFHLALSFESEVAATGGPNLPFRDAGLVERAAAHVPGQASEVLLGPGRAEHVPGCNMAFRRDRLMEIGGFDERYVAAGDDVDVCWRLFDEGYEIGFSPSAQVDHHRRATMRGFLRQQRGYGRAERMLAGPHRHRLNLMRQARWSGFVYGPGALLPGVLRSTVYTGWFGTAPFQPAVSHRAVRFGGLVGASSPVVAAAGLVAGVAGFVAPVAWIVTAVAAVWLVGVGLSAAASAQVDHREPSPRRIRLLVGALTALQPLVRAWGRVSGSGLDGAGRAAQRTWAGDRLAWIDALARELRGHGRLVRIGATGDFWDLEVTDHGPVSARITTAVVWNWEPRSVVRYRLRPGWIVGLAAVASVALLGGAAPGGVTVLAIAPVIGVSATRTRRSVRRALAATANRSLSAPELSTNP